MEVREDAIYRDICNSDAWLSSSGCVVMVELLQRSPPPLGKKRACTVLAPACCASTNLHGRPLHNFGLVMAAALIPAAPPELYKQHTATFALSVQLRSRGNAGSLDPRSTLVTLLRQTSHIYVRIVRYSLLVTSFWMFYSTRSNLEGRFRSRNGVGWKIFVCATMNALCTKIFFGPFLLYDAPSFLVQVAH